jgi:hypothetical protein
MPSTSATTWVMMVDEPWPMSEAPVSMVTLASKSSLRMITACGSPDQCTGLAEPLTKCEQATPSPLPMWPARPSLPLRAFQPLAASTQSRHSGRP